MFLALSLHAVFWFFAGHLYTCIHVYTCIRTPCMVLKVTPTMPLVIGSYEALYHGAGLEGVHNRFGHKDLYMPTCMS